MSTRMVEVRAKVLKQNDLLARALRSEGHVQEADAAMQRVVQLHTSSLDAEKHALKDAGVVGAR